MTQHESDTRHAEAIARVGTTLRGKWHLDSLLGLGGMAAVYAATHRNGMRGAVKVLDLSLSRLDSMRQRFLREGYLANKVAHPCAVRVLDDDIAEDGSAFLVMELLAGKTLEDLSTDNGGRLAPRDVLAWAAQILDALDAAHALGIIHRDIKPDNLFVTDTGIVKVLDFGLARMLESERTPTSTQSGVSMGTPAFMSPEQARGRWDLVDARSDLWAVAATMFTLVSGRMVHQDQTTAAEMIAATFTKQAPSLASVVHDAPPELVAVVDGGLRLEREERWSNASAMAAAVHVAFHAITGVDVPKTPSSPPLPRMSSPSLPDASTDVPTSRPSKDVIMSFSPTWSQRPRSPDAIQSLPPVSLPPKSVRTWWVLAATIVLCVVAAFVIARERHSTTAAITPTPSTLPPPAPIEEHTAVPAAVSAANVTVIVPVATSAPIAKTKAHPTSVAASVKDAGPSAPPPAPATTNLFDRRY